MTDTGRVTLEVRDRIAWVTLRRPQRLNALAGDMREQFRDRVGEAAASSGPVDALIVTGEGRAFCAGGDVDTMARLRQQEDGGGFRRILHAGAECALALQAFPGLTVAAINGVAAGAGLALALNCDLRVAVPEARLIASWSRIGLAPDWGASHWLAQSLGYSRALSLVLAGGQIDAPTALEWGLLQSLADPDDLLRCASELAATHSRSPETVAAIRQLLRKGSGGTLEASLAAETEAQDCLLYTSPSPRD